MSTATGWARHRPTAGPMVERIPYGAWPRMLITDRAAAYVGAGRQTFLDDVKKGIWPAPETRGRRSLWDRVLLDRAQDARSGMDHEPGEADALRALNEHRTA